MKQFNTVTEYEILKAASSYFLERWNIEYRRLERAKREGRYLPLTETRCERYWNKVKELRKAIIEIEENE